VVGAIIPELGRGTEILTELRALLRCMTSLFVGAPVGLDGEAKGPEERQPLRLKHQAGEVNRDDSGGRFGTSASRELQADGTDKQKSNKQIRLF